MKFIKLCVFVIWMIISMNTIAQQTLPKEKAPVNKKKEKSGNEKSITNDDQSSELSISAGIGIANYFGDLMEHNRFYSQSGFAFGAGASYAFANKFSARFDVGIQQVKAADSKNKGVQYIARNLSFKSNIVDIALGLDYYLLNIKKHGFTPYVSAGVGLMFFNPYANDVSGKKQNLRELGTEGQGLAGFPGMYSKTAVTIPVGFGLKIAASKNVSLHLEFNYRFTGTDYLDDVSYNGYVEKAVLDARNPLTSKFTYRGNEVPGGEPYPANLKLPRGNPKNKDGYYSTQIKIAYTIKMKPPPVKPPVPIPAVVTPTDRDGDSILDVFDRCPDTPGLTYLQGCPDKDADGIADMDDKCPDVVGFIRYQGCPVPDTDADGVNDELDKCPTEAGILHYLGCPVPDTDGDGLKDDVDVCPFIAGSAENKGCPIPVVEGAQLINTTVDSMTYLIYFDFERSNLLPDAFQILKRIVDILKADNSLYVIIAGHADTTGTDAVNMRLSAERANISRDYFQSYYINANRITTSFYGAERPVNIEQQWLNRRVEITLYRK